MTVLSNASTGCHFGSIHPWFACVSAGKRAWLAHPCGAKPLALLAMTTLRMLCETVTVGTQ